MFSASQWVSPKGYEFNEIKMLMAAEYILLSRKLNFLLALRQKAIPDT